MTRIPVPNWVLPDGVPAPMRPFDGRLGPPVPWGRRVPIPGRGAMFVREVPGPVGAPTLVLLHGWMASGGLNWFRSFEALAREFRVLAPDLRGHARGPRARRFRLEDCADDVAALCRALDVDRALVAGYSMGGPVSQLLWRRHPELVSGLVLVATSDGFAFGPAPGRVVESALGALATGIGVAETGLRLPTSALRAVLGPRRPLDFVDWATAELGRHSIGMLAEAAGSVSRYQARDWIGQVDVPTAVVVTTRDRIVPPDAQLEMAEAIRYATVHPVDGGHGVCMRDRFVAPLFDACSTVAARSIA